MLDSSYMCSRDLLNQSQGCASTVDSKKAKSIQPQIHLHECLSLWFHVQFQHSFLVNIWSLILHAVQTEMCRQQKPQNWCIGKLHFFHTQNLFFSSTNYSDIFHYFLVSIFWYTLLSKILATVQSFLESSRQMFWAQISHLWNLFDCIAHD